MPEIPIVIESLELPSVSSTPAKVTARYQKESFGYCKQDMYTSVGRSAHCAATRGIASGQIPGGSFAIILFHHRSKLWNASHFATLRLQRTRCCCAGKIPMMVDAIQLPTDSDGCTCNHVQIRLSGHARARAHISHRMQWEDFLYCLTELS